MEAPKLEKLNQEDLKVVNFVQEEAKKQNKVFFYESADGPELEINNYCLFCIDGWLIPNNEVSEFQKIYKNNYDELETLGKTKWDKYSVTAEWEKTDNGFKYNFVNYSEMFN